MHATPIRRRAFHGALPLLALLAATSPAFAAGGVVVRKTDGQHDAIVRGLAGTGVDRFITQYTPADFSPGSIICGARLVVYTAGNPNQAPIDVEIRTEDFARPGFPDLTPAGLFASADPASEAPCGPPGVVNAIWVSFGNGLGIPYPAHAPNLFLCAIEPLHGAGANDVCGILIDDDRPFLGAAKTVSGGVFEEFPMNHFLELVVFDPLGAFDEVEPNDTFEQATPVACASVTRARINPSANLDYFRVALPVATRFVAETATAGDTLMALYDEEGRELGTDDDSGPGLGSRIERDLGPGVYFVEVADFFADDPFAYTLTVACDAGGVDETEPNDDAGSADPIACGDAKRGTMNDVGDVDAWVFPLPVPKTQGVTLALDSGNVAASLLIRDAALNPVAEAQGANPEIVASLPPGDYFAFVRAIAPGDLFDYTLSLDCVPLDETEFGNNNPATGTPIASGDAFDGLVGPASDEDHYKLAIAAASDVTIDVDSGAGDSTLALFDAAGNEIAFNDDHAGAGSRITKLLFAGDYTFRVREKGDDDVLWYTVAVAVAPLPAPRLVSLDPRDFDNERKHHTDRYRMAAPLILRRGDTFEVRVRVSPEFRPDAHEIVLAAAHAFDGAAVTIPIPVVAGRPQPGAWEAGLPVTELLAGGDRRIAYTVSVPGDAPVGRYGFDAAIRLRGNPANIDALNLANGAIVLFNAWSDLDTVRIAGEEWAKERERREYVLNENVRLLGDDRAWFGRRLWNLGQFGERTLLVALDCIEGLGSADRAKPEVVTRRLAEKSNASEGAGDDGILILRPTPVRRLPGAESPYRFFTTDQILAAYCGPIVGGQIQRRDKVKYGGGYHHTALHMSLLRSLGIPARQTTSVGYALDQRAADGTYDRLVPFVLYLDQRPREIVGERVYGYNNWCEVWMKSAGLAAAEWHATEAKPTQTIVGVPVTEVGPTPVSQIRAKAANTGDVGFFVSGVDADVKCYFGWGDRLVERMNPFTGLPLIDTVFVGREIYTPRIGFDAALLDVRNAYKAQPADGFIGGVADVAYSLETEDSVESGTDIVWRLRIENLSGVAKTFNAALAASSVIDDGFFLGELGETFETIALGPEEVGFVTLTVPASLYEPFLGDTRSCDVMAAVRDEATDAGFMEVARTVVLGPDVEVTLAPGPVVDIGTPVTATIRFTNTLPFDLTGAVLTLDGGDGLPIGDYLGEAHEEIEVGTIAPGATVEYVRELFPVDPRRLRFEVLLRAVELVDSTGGADIFSILDCAEGTVNLGVGEPADVLFVNGTAAAEFERRVEIDRADPIAIRVENPPSKETGRSRYALYLWTREPSGATRRFLPYGLGATCLPTPLTPGGPQPKRIGNNVGKTRILGEDNWPGGSPEAAPATVLDRPNGIGKAITLFVQGIILDASAPNGQAAVTNGITIVTR